MTPDSPSSALRLMPARGPCEGGAEVVLVFDRHGNKLSDFTVLWGNTLLFLTEIAPTVAVVFSLPGLPSSQVEIVLFFKNQVYQRGTYTYEGGATGIIKKKITYINCFFF